MIRTGSLLIALLLLAAPAGMGVVRAQESISRVKSAPQEYRNQIIELRGEVVELRAISPRSGQGMYRLVDASDRVGLLVRTNELPASGGPYDVEARLSPEILSDGILLLDELDRSTARLPLLPVAAALGGLGLVATAVAAGLLLRARQRERRHRLAPPMWLIPTGAEPQVEGSGGPQVRFNYQLQYIEEERSEDYLRQKRTLLGVLAVAGTIGLAGTGWFALLEREDAARPSFVLTSPELVYTPPVSQQERTPREPVQGPADTVEAPKPQPPPPPPPPPPRRAETPPRTRRDTARRVAVEPPPPARRDSVVIQPAPVVVLAPPPAPIPPPPPPPPAVVARADTAAAPPPAISAEALRAGASVEIRSGIDRFVSAIRSGQTGTAELLYVPERGEESRKARFISFLKESKPGVSVAAIEGTSVTETSGGARFTLQFRWRGEFGADRRKAVRFWAAARREGTNWVFTGVRLLENLP